MITQVEHVNIPTIKLSNGQEVPCIGLGTTQKTSEIDFDMYHGIKFALRVGYRLFDTAWVNFNHSIFFRILSELKQDFGDEVKRDDLFIVSKLWNTFHSKEMVGLNIAETLKIIGVNYIDLFLIHWPMGFKENVGTEPFPVDSAGNLVYSNVNYLETYRAIEEFVKNGTVKNIGLCNFNISQIEEILKNCEIKPVVNQVEVHPYFQNDDLIEFCQNNGITVMAYSPLGLVDPSDKNLANVIADETIKKMAEKYNKTPAQICIKWCLQRGLITILNSFNPDYIIENAKVFDFEISQEDLGELKKLNKNLRIHTMPRCKKHELYPFEESILS